MVKVSQQLDDRIASLVRGIEDERLWRADIELLLLGSKGVAFFHRRAFKVRKGYTTLFSNVTYAQAEEIAADLRDAYVTRIQVASRAR